MARNTPQTFENSWRRTIEASTIVWVSLSEWQTAPGSCKTDKHELQKKAPNGHVTNRLNWVGDNIEVTERGRGRTHHGLITMATTSSDKEKTRSTQSLWSQNSAWNNVKTNQDHGLHHAEDDLESKVPFQDNNSDMRISDVSERWMFFLNKTIFIYSISKYT